jgi:uncharacterized membrane protein (DUF4010 family)
MTVDVGHLAVALGIGLLLGVERERHKGRGRDRREAGVRTFALVGLLGGLSIAVGGAATAAVALGFVGLAAVAGYVRRGGDDPGVTTEVALVCTLLLGALAQRDPALAAGAAVAVAIVLAVRHRLHVLVRDTLSEQELHDGLLFAACALIVLPLVPDHGIGPYDAFNPRTVWLLVVVVMGVQAAGHIALRTLGARSGLPLSGLIGGFVSATATIGTLGARARENPELRRPAIAGATSASVATILLLAVLVGAADGPTLARLAAPFGLAGIATLAWATRFAVRSLREPDRQRTPPGRAFDLRIAALLAVTVSAVLVVSVVLEHKLGQGGVILAAAISGFADAQACAISAASLAHESQISPADASLAVLAGLTTNTISKGAVAALLGGRAFARHVCVGLALLLAGAWAGWAVLALAGGFAAAAPHGA